MPQSETPCINLESRLVNLEEQLTFQDDLIEQLNQQLSQQQLDLNRLEHKLSLMLNYVQDLKNQADRAAPAPSWQDEIPPHY